MARSTCLSLLQKLPEQQLKRVRERFLGFGIVKTVQLVRDLTLQGGIETVSTICALVLHTPTADLPCEAVRYIRPSEQGQGAGSCACGEKDPSCSANSGNPMRREPFGSGERTRCVGNCATMTQSDLIGRPARTGVESAAAKCSLAARVVAALPSLRRYARFLTGSQFSGDKYAAATLEVLLADRQLLAQPLLPRIILFKTFHTVWQSSGHLISQEPVCGLETRAHSRLSSLIPNSREALLLYTGEEFNREEIGEIMGIDAEEADALLQVAYREMGEAGPGTVMIIEDEPLIAMDLRSIVEDMGHSVVGVATTRCDAVRLGRSARPSMILSDIQLADNSSGIDAVKELLPDIGEVPAIFITAFPERLLTGEQLEPVFLIAKPFTEQRVRSVVSQAMFFSPSELESA